ncbi:uncharacterized protein LOC119682720 [Teleopsis dalmanni]|uniref:uncharacterized protein LOC119682720 n=1 Tax=Teleopsis dalmanni TaxID=139649 RepID=UPI0018CDC709|nr:uncharacterized protein LOC119682720 [Teleopsis dalmanni]
MMKSKYLYIIIKLLTIFQALRATTQDEILELQCTENSQCSSLYQNSEIKATCNNGTCECMSNNQTVQCKPKIVKLNNIIGGACPCPQPNAECFSTQDICYCAKDYLPSVDRRRCLREKQGIDEPCEEDFQCQYMQGYAECNKAIEYCMCKSGFMPLASKCVSIIKDEIECGADSDCNQFGEGAECALTEKKCVCSWKYVKHDTKDLCIPTVPYNGTCKQDAQCQGIAGANSICKHKKCGCAENYIPHKVTNSVNEQLVVCERIVERGQYCRSDIDCYQYQHSEIDQTLYCYQGECTCRDGYFSINDSDCIKGSSATKVATVLTNLLLAIGSSAVVIFHLYLF